MNRRSPLLAAALGLLASPISPAADAPAPVRVMPLGDSLTESSPGYRGPLYSLLNGAGYRVEFVGTGRSNPKDVGSPRHEGHGGFTIGPGASAADAWTNGKGNLYDNLDDWLKEKPDLILLLIGTNDFFNIGNRQPGYDPERDGAARLAGLLDKIHKLSPRSLVVVSSIMPVAWDPKFAARFNGAVPDLVAKRPFARFADLNRTSGFREGDWSEDKLHPSPRGYEKLARAWFDALKPLLDDRR